MRRFLLPAVVLALAIAASVLAGIADDSAEPDDPTTAPTDALGTPLLSVRRAPEWLRQPTTSNLLDAAVRAPVEAVGAAAAVCVAVHVDGDPVTEVDSTLPFIPGDAERLLTLTALDTVGTGGFTTEVVRAADAVITEEGVLEGDLWLIGGADPVLSTSAYISRFDDGRAFTSLEELAASTVQALQAESITEVAGRIIGVDAKYSGSPQDFGNAGNVVWTSADRASGVVGATAGLLVDNGLTSFPEEIDPRANVRSSDPVTHAAAEFTALVEAAGVDVAGSATEGEAPAAVSRRPLASIDSPPLVEIAKRALVDGTTAEMLWREVAVRGGDSADSFAVLLGVNSALIELGLIPDSEAGNLPKWDGSGLSLASRSRCATLAGVLDPDLSGLAGESLPLAAESELAECAPVGLNSLHVTASARPQVTSMAGRAVASNGDTITFAVLANWAPGDNGNFADQNPCDGLLPAVLDAIAAHPAGPALDALTPLDPVPAS